MLTNKFKILNNPFFSSFFWKEHQYKKVMKNKSKKKEIKISRIEELEVLVNINKTSVKSIRNYEFD